MSRGWSGDGPSPPSRSFLSLGLTWLPPSPSPGLRVPIQHRWRYDGVNSLGYRLLSKELQALYTNLTVDISVQVPGPPVPS